MFVIDASVVIKWFVIENDSPKARILKENHSNGKDILIAPDLLIYEVANALLISKLFKPSDVERCIKDLYDLEIDFITPSSDIILSASELAINKHISIYDASYLAIANDTGAKLITADDKLYKSASDLHCIELLSHI